MNFFILFKSSLHSNVNLLPANSDSHILVLLLLLLQEEVREVASALSVHCHNIKVTEVLKDGDTLTFLIVCQKVRK